MKGKNRTYSILAFLLIVCITISGIQYYFFEKHKIEVYSEIERQENRIEDLEKREKDIRGENSNIIKGLMEKIKSLEGKVEQEVLNKNNNSNKIVYLTFDDGPSHNTVKVLDILKENNIQATFFVIGKPQYKSIYKRMNEEGHTIGNHTYTHSYESVYQSIDAFKNDVNKLNLFLKEMGIEPTNILRFPGGSNNTVSHNYGGESIMHELSLEMMDEGYEYYDWNVSSEDATKELLPKEEIVQSVKDGCNGKSEAVILFHDSGAKTTTVDALPEIIKHLKVEGYEFRTIDESNSPVVKFK